MGSNGGDEVMISGCCETECSEATTIEIKIKTLDSQTYSLQVDKCVPVPALKEQIAIVTGVVSEQQRLICRGRVLKDDQLLSAYHVEDGHTLHLVVRQPISTTFEDMPIDSGADTFSSPHYSQAGPRLVVGTVNLSEQGDGVFPELSHIFSAVLGSFGVNNIGNSSEGINNAEVVLERLSRTSGPNGLEVSGRREPDQTTVRNWSNPLSGVSTPLPTTVPLENLQPQVVPDSLTTLSQYLSHLRDEFSANVNGHSNNPQAESNSASAGQNGIPTPSSLAEVLLSTREILTQQVAECLSQLARQLGDQLNTTNPLIRRNVQISSLSVGVLLHNLGALLLELGRTTMTLRMGQTPGDAVVNAGPAVFISPSGPTPIMVQPPHLGTRVGAIPSGNMQSSAGFLPRNVDIRFRTGSSAPTALNQSEPSGTRQTPEQTNPVLSGVANSVHQTAGRNPSFTRESGVRVVPIRAVVATVPAAVRHSPSDSTRHPVGVVYPVIARVQHVTSRNLNSGTQTHPQHGRNEQLPRMSPGEQLPRMSPGEQIHASGDVNFNFEGPPTSSFSPHAGMSESNAATRGPEPQVSNEGTFLSNLLHQILPLVSSTESNIASTNEINVSDNSNRQTSTTQAQENSDVESSSRRRPQGNLPTPPSSKRQKRE